MPRKQSFVRAPSGRTEALERAIAAAEDESAVTLDLPDEIREGTISFTFMHDPGYGPSAQDITFSWDGGYTATWVEDISNHEELSPASSAPAYGWMSWRNGKDLLIAYTWPDLDVDGWAHVPGGVPGSDSDAGMTDDWMYEPPAWVRLARIIADVLHEAEIPGMSAQRFG